MNMPNHKQIPAVTGPQTVDELDAQSASPACQ
jgi:hypothetical protein